MKLRLLLILGYVLLCVTGHSQIRNRMKVDDRVFQRYAYGRMQQYSPDNIALADSIYNLGVLQGNARLRTLGLALELPVRFILKDYSSMDAAMAEISSNAGTYPETREFYYTVSYDYCQYLILLDRVSDAMLEARAMGKMAAESGSPSGQMYSLAVTGFIQQYRSNPEMAIENFSQAIEMCKEAKAESELPNLYLFLAQEYMKLKDVEKADKYCSMAEEYTEYFPALRIRTLTTRAYLHSSTGNLEAFREYYDKLSRDPLFKVQIDNDARLAVEIRDLWSRGMARQALEKIDSIKVPRWRLESKHTIQANMGDYTSAYASLLALMHVKDSIAIAVQNEDMAVLDAEMHNAQLREEASRLKAKNQAISLIGFILMNLIALTIVFVAQFRVRTRLAEMDRKNRELKAARNAYQKALEAQALENEIKIKIIQKRKNNTFVV